MLYEHLLKAIEAAEQFLEEARELAEIHAVTTVNPHHLQPELEIHHPASHLRRTFKRLDDMVRAAYRAKRGYGPHVSMPRAIYGTSQYKGVSWHAKARKWMAYLPIPGGRIYLGLHATEHDAHQAVIAARREYETPS